MERQFIHSALERNNWDKGVAAEEIGLTETALSKKIKEHQLQR
jgi:DNA-binding NtrC family response regulator